MPSSDFTFPHADSANPPPPLIGALLRMPFQAVRARMLAALHEHDHVDLIAAHMDIFQWPGPWNMRPSDLAARTGMTKQALNYLLGQLEELGYLTREPDIEDRRFKRIRITPRSVQAVAVIRESVREVEDEWSRQLGRERFEQLRDLLLQLQSPPPADPAA